MISFRDYLIEQTSPTGNYASVGLRDNILSVVPNIIHPSSGKIVPKEKQHATVIYSKESSVCHDKLRNLLMQCHIKSNQTGMITGWDSFDSAEGDKSTLVAKLDSDCLRSMHEAAKTLGCVHSYDEYSPHISVAYNVDPSESRLIAGLLNRKQVGYGGMLYFPLNTLVTEPVNETFVDDMSE